MASVDVSGRRRFESRSGVFSFDGLLRRAEFGVVPPRGIEPLF